MNDLEQRGTSADGSGSPPDRWTGSTSAASVPKSGREVDRWAWTIDEFCRSHAIGRTTFYKLVKRGLGPQLMAVGARRLISAEAAEAWRRQREDDDARRPASTEATTTTDDRAGAKEDR